MVQPESPDSAIPLPSAPLGSLLDGPPRRRDPAQTNRGLSKLQAFDARDQSPIHRSWDVNLGAKANHSAIDEIDLGL